MSKRGQMLTINAKFPSLNEYTEACRRNPHLGSAMKKTYTEIVKLQAESQHLKRIDRPVCVTCYWTEANRRRDIDNIAFRIKFILDGLVQAGVLPDDSPKYVQGLNHRFFYPEDVKGCSVSVMIKELRDNPLYTNPEC